MAFGRLGSVGAGFGRLGNTGSGGTVAVAGGGALLAGEANGFATDFTHAVDAERVAVKTSGTVVASTVDGFFTNAGTSPKMVYDVAGTLVWSPHNICLQSQTFDNASWTKTLGTVSANAVAAPDATTTADAWIPNNGVVDNHLSQGSIAVSNGVAHTFSIYAKNGTLGNNWIQLLLLGAGGEAKWFNLATGVMGSAASGAVLASSITDVGSGWYRLTMSFTATSASGTMYLAPRIADGSGGSITGNGTSPAFYAWGAQMNRGATATAYLPTTTAARFGLPLDYDPVTHAAKGLLCEPAATNLLLNNATLSTQSVTVTAAAHTLSIFGTGTVTLTGTSTAGPLVGTGANNRVSLTFTPTAGSLTLTVSGSVTKGQLETGTAATSPIPTVGSTVTRAGDNYNCTPASIGFSATAGSWWAEVYLMGGAADEYVIGSSTTVSPMLYNVGGVTIRDGTQIYIPPGPAIAGNTNKLMSAFTTGSRAITYNGQAPAADAGAVTNLLTPSYVGLGSGSGASGRALGYIRKLRYLPRRPSNAEMQTMTT